MHLNENLNLWMLPLLPLCGAFILGTLGRKLSRGDVSLIACGSVLASFVAAVAASLLVAEGHAVYQRGDWFTAGMLHVGAGLRVDELTAVMLLVITGIGFLIHLYSVGYMAHDEAPARFFAYLNLFVAAMLILVLADNLVLLFVGWEGVGLCSYLLIGFWYTHEPNATAGKKAFIVNRVGDFGFTLAVFGCFALFGSVGFSGMAGTLAGLNPATILTQGVFAGWTLVQAVTLICLLFLVGVAGKSAQIPLYVWLPDAMAGPTPVSALIHAATMVTAGVYLMCRMSFLFAMSGPALTIVAFVGAATCLFAAIIATAQNDIKKVLAYSTVSQLGYMVMAVGVGAYWAAVLHLVTHACFKALLFLGAGSVIHGMHEDQDLTHMGGLYKRLPQTARAFLIGGIAITGVLPLSGFFSKDTILGLALHTGNKLAPWAPGLLFTLGSIGALGTSFYIWRLCTLAFFGEPRTEAASHAHEAPWQMTVVTWTLAALSVVTLYLGLPFADGAPLQRFLAPVFVQATRTPSVLSPPQEEGIPWGGYLIALVLAWAGFGLAYLMFRDPTLKDRLAQRFRGLLTVVRQKFYVDELYDAVIVKPLWGFARLLWRVIDVVLIDTILVRGSAALMTFVSRYILRPLQTGNAQSYATVMALGAVALLYVLLR
jgi:NADH-quinone oxidoreductase subunit L